MAGRSVRSSTGSGQWLICPILHLLNPPGSGKSTVVGLIERYYDPLSGAVTLDGADLRTLNLAWLRGRVRIGAGRSGGSTPRAARGPSNPLSAAPLKPA